MKKLTLFIILIFLVGCAGGGSNYRPMVDMAGQSQARYNSDVYSCQQYAQQVSPVSSGAIGMGVGAGFGAALGAIVGAFLGCAGEGAAMGAAVGGFSGGVRGTSDGLAAQVNIIRNCMAGRGWNVLY